MPEGQRHAAGRTTESPTAPTNPTSHESLCPLGACTLLLGLCQHWPAGMVRVRSLRHALQTMAVGCSSRQGELLRRRGQLHAECQGFSPRLVGRYSKRIKEALCFTLRVCRAEVAVLVRFAGAWPTIPGGVTHYSKLKPSSSSPLLLLLLIITVFDSPFSAVHISATPPKRRRL